MNFNPDPADLVLSSVPGGELFNPRKHKFAEEDLKPQPMIKKAKKVFVPDEQKVTCVCVREGTALVQEPRAPLPQFDFIWRFRPPYGHHSERPELRAQSHVLPAAAGRKKGSQVAFGPGVTPCGFSVSVLAVAVLMFLLPWL